MLILQNMQIILGAKSEHVNSISDLEAAFMRAKASDIEW